ncbi:hypothetical protein B9Z19DRAFT_1131810 [Tuber borchii]|uniref:Uncharacterized protein n=1 Tax=Tuber borchii TaxID=42251 RepID=A0A2T6ZIF7_TUBBO|nr:hypothetical protein B9Z19DRAFT_1131810 [Tuber borchii]
MALTMTGRSSRTRSYFVGLFLLLVSSLGLAVPPVTCALVEAPSSLQNPTGAPLEVVMEAMQLGLKKSETLSGVAGTWSSQLLSQAHPRASYILKSNPGA